MTHVCYMEGGSIMNAFSGCIIERPAILVSKEEDIILGWGESRRRGGQIRKVCLRIFQSQDDG